MKKLLLSISVLALIVSANSCKKDDDAVSTTLTASYPTITFTGQPFYSINTGGTVPSISATSYDSLLKESYPVNIVGTDAIDNSTPGLYIILAEAKNRNGYVTQENVVVAVTNIPASEDLSGDYKRTDVGTGDIAEVTQLARGLYQTDNIAGANRAARPDLLFPVLFVHVDDTTVLLPTQATAAGTLSVKDANGVAGKITLNRTSTDTNYRYAITGPTALFGGALRTFTKQ